MSCGTVGLAYSITKDGYVGFQLRQSTCVKCSFWNECVGTTTPSGRKISVSPYYDYIRERREKQKSEAFRKEMSVRAQIEGTISEGTRFHGLRHARYPVSSAIRCNSI
jgi:hypothetical protein